MRWKFSDGWLNGKGAARTFRKAFARKKMAGINALGACGLLLSSAACSKISPLQQLVQQSATPAPSDSKPESPAANSTDIPANTAPLLPVQAPVASAPGEPPSAAAGAPAAAPALQPHPATGAKEVALKMYPALGVKDSAFNKVFRDLYGEKARQDPEYLTKADWPLLLARRTAELLAPPTASPASLAAQARPDAIASAPSAIASPPSRQAESPASSGHSFHPVAGPNALDRGAYHQVRSPYWQWDGYAWVYYPPITTTPAPRSMAGSTDNPTPSSNPLDRGAYNQSRSPGWWPWTRYYYP